jgi:hypothetical protein
VIGESRIVFLPSSCRDSEAETVPTKISSDFETISEKNMGLTTVTMEEVAAAAAGARASTAAMLSFMTGRPLLR